MIKGFTRLIFSIIFVCFFEFCNENKKVNTDGVKVDQVQDLKTGGIYLLRREDSTYYIAKILIIDDFTVHLRKYANVFKTKPNDINSSNLKVMIGHVPLDKNGFLIEQPELLKIEDVKDSELEGYKIYIEEMSK